MRVVTPGSAVSMITKALFISLVEIPPRPSAPYGKPPENDLRRKSGCRKGQSSEQSLLSCDPLRPCIGRLTVLSVCRGQWRWLTPISVCSAITYGFLSFLGSLTKWWTTQEGGADNNNSDAAASAALSLPYTYFTCPGLTD